jgi:hypothetical protein
MANGYAFFPMMPSSLAASENSDEPALKAI